MSVLVAGIGNVFLGDDGFGPAVAQRLAGADPVPGVRIVDYGIRGLHLAYDLLAGWDRLVLVDALPGAPAGEVVVLEVGPHDLAAGDFDPHGMNPVAVLGALSGLGGTLPPTVLVGCRVATVDEGIGLSPPVAAAVPRALDAVRAVLAHAPVAEPDHSAAEPDHGVVRSDRGVAEPNRGVARSDRGVAEPDRGVAEPRRARAAGDSGRS